MLNPPLQHLTPYKNDAIEPDMTTDEKTIKLDQFLKWVGAAQTGGEAKLMIQGGFVKVNGETETRRARKLVKGDAVMVQEATYKVEWN